MEKEHYLRHASAGTYASTPYVNMAKRLRKESTSSGLEENESEAIRKSRSQSVESTAHTPKYASIEPTETESSNKMRCSLPPHKPLRFNTYAEYESHYQQAHTNRCTECKHNFPTGHFLELHIAENHDPIVASKREAGEKTYACFVEGCDKVCAEWKKRRSHLVDKHGFPKNYDFRLVDHGIDGRRSMLRPGIDAQGHRKSSRERLRSSSSATEATQTTEATSLSDDNASAQQLQAAPTQSGGSSEASNNTKAPTESKDGDLAELTTSMSSLNMVPRSITFGRRKGRSGFAKS